MSRIHVLRVPFDPVTQDEAVLHLDQLCSREGQSMCVTPNPEIVLAAQKDDEFRRLIEDSQLSVPDGIGILWAASYSSGPQGFLTWIKSLVRLTTTVAQSPLPERVTGVDVMTKFCNDYPKRKIFLLGASKAVNDRLSRLLFEQGVAIVGNISGNDRPEMEEEICERIRSSGAEVLFVAFGAPRQEKWIKKNLSRFPNVKVAMGVGGAFDFLTVERARAPQLFQKLGIEWLYRLLQEPRRVRRIFNATVVFPWKVYQSGKAHDKIG